MTFSKNKIAAALIIFGFPLIGQPTAEIYNKSKGNISITYSSFTTTGKTVATVSPQGTWSTTVNINDMPDITIFDKTNNLNCECKCLQSSAGKTKYLSWNPDKDRKNPLYPQTGTFLGLSGKTESGFSLKNNVKASDLKISCQ